MGSTRVSGAGLPFFGVDTDGVLRSPGCTWVSRSLALIQIGVRVSCLAVCVHRTCTQTRVVFRCLSVKPGFEYWLALFQAPVFPPDRQWDDVLRIHGVSTRCCHHLALFPHICLLPVTKPSHTCVTHHRHPPPTHTHTSRLACLFPPLRCANECTRHVWLSACIAVLCTGTWRAEIYCWRLDCSAKCPSSAWPVM